MPDALLVVLEVVVTGIDAPASLRPVPQDASVKTQPAITPILREAVFMDFIVMVISFC